MKPEEFEDQLRRQSFRPVPESWKEEILRQARTAASGQVEAQTYATVRSGSWLEVLREWLWPHPLAWAGMAAVWLALAAVNVFTQASGDRLTHITPSDSPEPMPILQEQQRRWSDLLVLLRSQPADPSQPDSDQKSQPRTQSYDNILLRTG